MTILVVAAVIIEANRVLVTRRCAGSHLAGLWEFPGGKVEPDEDPRHALERELMEELGVEVDVGSVIDVVYHRYPEKNVLLMFFETRLRAGSTAPACLGVDAIAWRGPQELHDNAFPPADVEVLAAVRARLGG